LFKALSLRAPGTLTSGFQNYAAVPVSVPVAVFVTVSVKTVFIPAVPYAVAGACSAAVARQAQEAGRRVSRAKEWVELQASWLRTERQVRKNRTRSYMNGSTETANSETENVIFYVSYGILTEFLRMNVILTYFCNGQTEIRKRRNGYVITVETTHD